MHHPAISAVLPVYNGEAYLEEAIRSVLTQCFDDFEFIIINDGSTDRSGAIIHSFHDPRIIYITNQINMGLVSSLNKGIQLAKGEYIARIDADDICLPDRFLLQREYLDRNKNMAAVASTIIFIDKNGAQTGNWPLDQRINTPEQIKKMMPFENCLAHPTLMLRKEILQQFLYKAYQKNVEDYDLWLRMLNRGYSIAKLTNPLLLYRVHENSVTDNILKKKNFFFTHAKMKWKFIRYEIKEGKFNYFTFRVSVSVFIDLIKGMAKSLKHIFKK